ncbi:male-enhanced antigen 1-like isoform X1 [Varroa jacobsoni]|uniref:male-enhanced antigen 1-like isoform X1 n=1 Tax=Varroa jacobsoni TaxID=62625 RepID=UPI000BF884D1|nr:male-enhanced antigen 1-like isoform X1 [Varroa jacobsoni]XP_022707765.1 male-enhanced antigen 1-like isoform X1 [Varroa jacobsoni]XP_022707766.1 male-enhanced antigen 1-like isoform X1 [Varroa jacobsoni]
MVLMSCTDENNPNDEAALDRRPHAVQALQDSDSEPDPDDPLGVSAANGGYSLLPQSVGSGTESDFGEDEDDAFPQFGGGGYLMDFTQPPHEWQPSEHDLKLDHNRDLHLDDEQIAKIKSVMEKISLPVAARPSWATQISEEEWNNRLQELLARFRRTQSNGTENSATRFLSE